MNLRCERGARPWVLCCAALYSLSVIVPQVGRGFPAYVRTYEAHLGLTSGCAWVEQSAAQHRVRSTETLTLTHSRRTQSETLGRPRVTWGAPIGCFSSTPTPKRRPLEKSRGQLCSTMFPHGRTLTTHGEPWYNVGTLRNEEPMPSTPEQRKARYQELHKDDVPVRALRAAITECTQAIRSIQSSLKQKATHCLRGHPRTPDNVRANNTCISCEKLRAKALKKSPKTHCSQGHPKTPENTNSSGQCVPCRKVYEKQQATKQKEKTAAKKAEREKVWIDSRTGKIVSKARKQYLKAHGWTQQMVETTLYEQGNVCGLCRKPFTDKDKACADHKHSKPPEPRGVLHSSCNAAIGLLKENPETCRAAAEYLEAWA